MCLHFLPDKVGVGCRESNEDTLDDAKGVCHKHCLKFNKFFTTCPQEIDVS
jgi:hypothetical protein